MTPSDASVLRFDNVGSLIRPDYLRTAWRAFGSGQATRSDLDAAQDRATAHALDEQHKRGYPILVDGEFRRRVFTETFHLVRGFEDWADHYARAAQHIDASASAADRWDAPSAVLSVAATAKLELLENAPLAEYRAASAHAAGPVKMTLIGPDRIFSTFDPEASRSVYPDPADFLADVVAVQRQIISGLVDAGCRYIQIDAPGFTAYVDPPSIDRLRNRGIDPKTMMRQTIAAENAVIEGFPGVQFGLHICRGNQNGHWHREGDYDAIAEELFHGLRHDRLLLEYDTERSGSFDALRHVPEGKIAVLGLVTTKDPRLESRDTLLRRIEQASQYVGIDQLAISPQCGFASGLESEVMTSDQQWRKLDLCLQVAREVWDGR